jgi:hypothetical protein
VVVTKPGYGIVSDAIGAGTAIVYTEARRLSRVPPILVEGMQRYVPCAYVSKRGSAGGPAARADRHGAASADARAAGRSDGAARAASRLLEIATTA